MARTVPTISVEEAHAVIKWLMTTGELTRKQIKDALKKREKLVSEIREKLEALGGEGMRLLRGQEEPQRPKTKHRRRPASAKAKAAWKAQGVYMAAVRRLSKADRVKVKSIREKKGVKAAITLAKKLAKG